MIVRDPTFFIYAFFDRHLPGHVEEDPREVWRRLYSGLDSLYALTDPDPEYRFGDVDKVDFVKLSRAGDGFTPWIGRSGSTAEGANREALGYSYGDTLFLHGLDSRDMSCEFDAGWHEVADPVSKLLGDCEWPAGGRGVWGLNVLYSVLVSDSEYEQLTSETVVTKLGAISALPPLRTSITVGQLWAVGSDWVSPPALSPQLVSTWVLISPETAEEMVQSTTHSISGTALAPLPPPLPMLLQARHKFYVQIEQYERSRASLRATESSLDKRIDWMIAAHRDLEESGAIIDSDEAEELRQKTTRAHTNLAAFEQATSLVEDAQSTLHINLRNQEEIWARLADSSGEDEIFAPEHTYMRRRIDQITYDAGYFHELIRRARATMAAAQGRLAISGDRAQAEQVRHAVTQVSGLIASLLALVLTEIFGLYGFARDRPVLAVHLILLTLTGSFALSQILLAWGRLRSGLTRGAVALSAGLAVSTLLAIDPHGRWKLWAAPVGFVAAAIGAYVLVRYREERPRLRQEPAWRRRLGYSSGIEKLRLAHEELADLLDDLPPTRYDRIKKDDSFREKIELKNERRAASLGISVDELHQRGLEYREQDITDAIGLRYVVSPWELPVLIQKLQRLLGPKLLGIDYKQGRYKSVHLDVDLWGIGARRDMNLMAEVQVRTRLQDFYANAVHDVIYKDVPGGGLWWLRLLKRSPATRWMLPFFDRLLSLPSDGELLLFKRWMRWRTPI